MKICGLSFSRFLLSGKVVTKTTTHMYVYTLLSMQVARLQQFICSHAQNHTDD